MQFMSPKRQFHTQMSASLCVDRGFLSISDIKNPVICGNSISFLGCNEAPSPEQNFSCSDGLGTFLYYLKISKCAIYESSIRMPKQFHSPRLETFSPSALLLTHSLHQLTRLICSSYNVSTNLKASKVFNEVIDLDWRFPWLSIFSLPEPAVGGTLTIHHWTHFLFVGLLPHECLDLENQSKTKQVSLRATRPLQLS